MKIKTESVSARLRYYGSNSTKKSLDCQVLLEIRNYTKSPIRISAKNSDNTLIHLRAHQMKKGVVVARSDCHLINARLNKLKDRTRYVMQFLKYNKMKLIKPNIEDWLYLKWQDVYSYFTEVEDSEDAEIFFKYLNQSIEESQKETLEKNQFLIDLGEYRATGFIEGLEMHKFENVAKDRIVKNFKKWCTNIGINDYPIVKFDKLQFDSFIRFVIKQPANLTNGKTPKKKADIKYYSVKSIDNLVKEIKIYLKALKNSDYKIDETALDFRLIKGNRSNAHIKFVNNEKDNVFSINAAELLEIRKAVYNTKLPEKLRKAATLFTIQTLLGGLRVSELNAIKKDSFKLVNAKYFCFITTKKTKKMIDSPLHSELLPILQKIKFNIESIRFSDDNYYNEALKELGKVLKFNREIVQLDSRANADTQSVVTEKLYNLLTTRQARKAAITLLFATGKYSLEQIAKMTKHSLAAIQYYVAILTDEKAIMMGGM